MASGVFLRDALLEYKQALERWNDKLHTIEDARVRVVEWRRAVVKLREHASNDLVAKTLKEALVYLANAEKKVNEMEPPLRAKTVPEKPRSKSVKPPITRWRDHWVPPKFW